MVKNLLTPVPRLLALLRRYRYRGGRQAPAADCTAGALAEVCDPGEQRELNLSPARLYLRIDVGQLGRELGVKAREEPGIVIAPHGPQAMTANQGIAAREPLRDGRIGGIRLEPFHDPVFAEGRKMDAGQSELVVDHRLPAHGIGMDAAKSVLSLIHI